ncbi:MAG: hypothetical protein CLLPBCKN_004066 [Chroococcidiopsis cubana SAG 39.79]|jgi:hypothetical protein|nr:hypothetical protein [Chroococcidiopsis cubana SAG 39.79]
MTTKNGAIEVTFASIATSANALSVRRLLPRSCKELGWAMPTRIYKFFSSWLALKPKTRRCSAPLPKVRLDDDSRSVPRSLIHLVLKTLDH